MVIDRGHRAEATVLMRAPRRPVMGLFVQSQRTRENHGEENGENILRDGNQSMRALRL